MVLLRKGILWIEKELSTLPPAFLKPGDIPFKATASTVAKNTCGGGHIGSLVYVKGDWNCNLYISPPAAEGGQSKVGNMTWHVPNGKVGDKISFHVMVRSPGGSGTMRYTYVYK